MKTTTKIYILLAVILLTAIISFFAGRSTIESKTDIVYVKGKEVHDTITIDSTKIVTETIPSKPVLPLKPDTIEIPGGKEVIVQVVDTAKLIQEYIVKREYYNILFDDDTQGRLTLGADVQYNKLTQIRYSFTPVEKKTVRERSVTPYISTVYNSLGFIEASAGIYFKDFGIQGGYVTDFNKKAFLVGISYKF